LLDAAISAVVSIPLDLASQLRALRHLYELEVQPALLRHRHARTRAELGLPACVAKINNFAQVRFVLGYLLQICVAK